MNQNYHIEISIFRLNTSESIILIDMVIFIIHYYTPDLHTIKKHIFMVTKL